MYQYFHFNPSPYDQPYDEDEEERIERKKRRIYLSDFCGDDFPYKEDKDEDIELENTYD